MGPACHRRRSHKTISCAFGCGCSVLAQRDSNDVWCVWFKNDCVAVSLKNHAGVLCMEWQPSKCCKHDRDQNFATIDNESHLNPLFLLRWNVALNCSESRKR